MNRRTYNLHQYLFCRLQYMLLLKRNTCTICFSMIETRNRLQFPLQIFFYGLNRVEKIECCQMRWIVTVVYRWYWTSLVLKSFTTTARNDGEISYFGTSRALALLMSKLSVKIKRAVTRPMFCLRAVSKTRMTIFEHNFLYFLMLSSMVNVKGRPERSTCMSSTDSRSSLKALY